MSIDPQEWSDKRMEAGSDVEATQVHIDLIRAVIADELPKHVASLLEPPKPPLPPQPVAAEGGVPVVKGCISLEEAQEWGCCRICGWSTRGPHGPENAVTLNYGKEFAHTRCLNGNRWIEAEISRRVAEAVAEKDKRIAFLDEQCSRNQQAYYAMTEERDTLKQQLAEAQAEVERLKRDAEQGQAVAEVANMHGWNGCEHSKVLSVHIAEELTELAKLREEVARLSRPVEGVRVGDLVEAIPPFTLHCGSGWYQNAVVTSVRPLVLVSCSGDMLWSHTVKPENIRTVGKPMPSILASAMKRFWTDAWSGALDGIGIESVGAQTERNARESAERERDELREFVREKCFWRRDDGFTSHVETMNRHWPVTDADIDKGLAAFRAEKGKVATDGHAPTNS